MGGGREVSALMLGCGHVARGVQCPTGKCDHRRGHTVIRVLTVGPEIHSVCLNYFNSKRILTKFWLAPLFLAPSPIQNLLSGEHLLSGHHLQGEGTLGRV